MEWLKEQALNAELAHGWVNSPLDDTGDPGGIAGLEDQGWAPALLVFSLCFFAKAYSCGEKIQFAVGM